MKTNQRTSFYLVIIMLGNQILAQYNNKIMNDIQTCIANEDTDTCSSTKLTSGIYQCCKLSETIYTPSQYSISICSIQVDIKLFKEEMERETTKALYKEIWGYVTNNMIQSSKIEMTYFCKDGTASTRFGFDTYTDEEIQILKVKIIV